MLTPAEEFTEALGLLAWQGHPVPCMASRGDDRWIAEDAEHRAQAAAGCEPCPLAADCRAEALRAHACWGVWAGVDMGEKAHQTWRRGR